MSAGTTPEITQKIVELAGKPAKEVSVCIINEGASMSDNDKRWLVDGFDKVSKAFGGKIGICNLLALDIAEVEKRIMGYDVIWCFGGNIDYTRYVFDKTGFTKLLPKILGQTVWVGSSGGSCIMGHRPVSFKVDKDSYGTTEFYGLVNLSLRPHIWSDYVEKDMYDKCVQESKKQQYPVYALSDECAIVVEDKKIYLIGKRGQKIENGKVTEEV